MADLPGTTTVIDAYLKGLALRQHREESQARLEIAQTQAKLAAERAKAQQTQFMANFAQRDELNKSTVKHRIALENAAEATRDLQAKRNKVAAIALRAQGLLDFDDEGNPVPPKPGASAQYKAGVAGAVTSAQQEAQLPFDAMRSDMLEHRMNRDREDKQNFLSDQNDKTRLNQVAMNNSRIEARAADQKIKRDQKIKDLEQDADDRAQDVFEGNPAGTVDMMPKGQLGVDIMRKIRARYGPIRQFTLAESNDLKGMRELTSIIKEGEALTEKIRKGGILAANGLDSDINAAVNKLQARVELWGRGVLDMKGVFQEGDVQRAYGSLPQLNPGGPISRFTIEKNFKNNKERMAAAKTMYHEKIDGLLGPSIDETQRTHLYKRWNLMGKDPDPNESEVDVGKIK